MEDQLPEVVLQTVLAKTDAIDCARAACVDRRWRQNSSDDALWRSYCLRDFGVKSPLDPQGKPCASFKATYQSWLGSFEDYPRPLMTRAKLCLDQIKDWLTSNFVEVRDSLFPGASSEEVEAAEAELGYELPAPVRLLYRLCNGQELPDDDDWEEDGSQVSNHVGLLGGYYVYSHFVNVHLLPLRQMVRLTLAIVPKLELPPGSRRVVIAASCNSVKIFFLDCDDGQVYVGTRNFEVYGDMMPCTPKQEGGVDLKDGMLRWLECYNHYLHTGMYRVRVELGFRYICLFPLKEPLCTVAITRGVEIRSAAVFAPELSTITEGEERSFLFSYSVSMRLLASSSEHGDSSLESAQLLARHWVIHSSGVEKSEVRGEAVIGQFPLLQAGGEEFVYQSCSNLKGKSGSIEGDFSFVPGRIASPGGANFTVYVARFPLEVPKYIF